MIAGLQIQYFVRGQEEPLALQKLSFAIERAGEEIANLGPRMFPGVATALEGELKGQFDAQGHGPQQGRWAELYPDYAKWKEEHFPGKPILQRTGAMMAALTDSADSHAARALAGEELDFGTIGIPYASFHQTGTSRMTDRPPYDFTDELQRNIQAAMNDAARAAVKESGLGEFFDYQESA